MSDAEHLLTMDEVAERLNVTRGTVRTLVYSHRIESVRVGRLVRIRPAAVDAYLATTTWEASGAPSRTDDREDGEGPPFTASRTVADG